MIGRREFGVVGLSALAYAALEGTGFAQERKSNAAEPHHTEHDEMYQKVRESLFGLPTGLRHVRHAFAHLMHSGQKEHLTTLMTCQDCANFCAAASQIVARGGPFADLICKSCAEPAPVAARSAKSFPMIST